MSYLLASRQKTHPKKVRPASKIVLLPTISRALVLSLSTASIFALPEFSPLTGIGSLRDVHDISRDIDDHSTEPEEETTVTAYTKTAIRIVRVQQNSLKLLTNIQYPEAKVGLQRSNFALVANSTHYDLIDLENNQQIPLFPISTGDTEENGAPEVEPMIAAVGMDEFLVLSGTKKAEPAMGLVVNKEGNISRGTIAWPQYPSSIAVEYPYVVSVIDKQVQVHSLHDQSLLQSIDYESVPIVTNVSVHISQPYRPLAEKIRLIPLAAKEEEEEKERIDKELVIAEGLSVITSSLFVYSKEKGIECLLSSPRIFHLEGLVEQEKIDEVVEEMSTLEVTTERGVVELEYLNQLVGFGYLFHKDFSSATDYWVDGSLDPRLLIEIYDSECVVGNLWIFNGINDILKKVKDKFSDDITIEKSSGKEVTGKRKKNSTKVITAKDQLASRQFYHYFFTSWLKKRDLESLSDKKNVFSSIEKACLKLLIKLDNETVIKKQELYTFIKTELIETWDDAIVTLKENERYYGMFLMYKENGQFKNACEIWKRIIVGEISDKDFKETEEQFAEYLIDNIKDHKKLVWEYGLWLANKNPKAGLHVFTEPEGHYDDTELMKAFKELDNKQVWRDFLRVLVYVKQNYSFNGELVLVSVEDLLTEINRTKKTREFMKKGLENYVQSSIPKQTFFASIERNRNKEFKYLVDMRLELISLLQRDGEYDTLLLKNKLETDGELLRLELCLVYDKLGLHERIIKILCHDLKDFDQCLQFCKEGRLALGKHNLVKADMETQRHFFAVLYNEYLKLEPESVQIECTKNLLESHGTMLDMRMVLDKTPDSWPLERLNGYLVHVLRQITKETTESTLSRSLARSQNMKVSKELKDFKALLAQDDPLRHENSP